MKRKIIAATLAVAVLITAFIFGVNGTVNLSENDKPSAGEKQPERNVLCGILATRTPLEEIFPDVYGEDSEVNSNERKYYLSMPEKTVTFDGYTDTVSDFDIDGFWYTVIVETPDNPDCSPVAVNRCNGVSNLRGAQKHTDTGKEEEQECTLYFIDIGEANILYFSSVYQDPDGKIYAVPYQKKIINRTISNISFCGTYTTEKTVDDITETQTETVKFIMNFEEVSAPVKMVISQFDSVGNILSRDEYATESIPEELTVNEETEYIVTESFDSSDEPARRVKREVIGKDADYFDAFVKIDYGVCDRKSITLNWQNQEDYESDIEYEERPYEFYEWFTGYDETNSDNYEFSSEFFESLIENYESYTY